MDSEKRLDIISRSSINIKYMPDEFTFKNMSADDARTQLPKF